MIVSTLTQSARIECLHPHFKRFFDFVKTHDWTKEPCGRIVLEGDEMYINVVESECKKAEEQVLEAHREYLDIHVLLEGRETIAWKPLADCKDLTSPYDATNDYLLYGDKAENYIVLHPREFMIVYPEDPHGPLIGEGKIRKLIGKIRIR